MTISAECFWRQEPLTHLVEARGFVPGGDAAVDPGSTCRKNMIRDWSPRAFRAKSAPGALFLRASGEIPQPEKIKDQRSMDNCGEIGGSRWGWIAGTARTGITIARVEQTHIWEKHGARIKTAGIGSQGKLHRGGRRACNLIRPIKRRRTRSRNPDLTLRQKRRTECTTHESQCFGARRPIGGEHPITVLVIGVHGSVYVAHFSGNVVGMPVAIGNVAPADIRTYGRPRN